jgi:adenine deaminase
MIFLPALTKANLLKSYIRELEKLGITLRGMYGEGSEAKAYIYQLSNSITMGITEEETISKLESVVRQLITNELVCDIDWNSNNGIDTDRDILKLAVVERHNNTGHIGLGFIKGIGIKNGAIASSVSHDSHNIIVIGSNTRDMVLAANHIRSRGGNVVVSEGRVLSQMALPIAGLMTDRSGEEIAEANEQVREAVYRLGVSREIGPFMNMAFVSLPVIPALKMTTQGLVDVTRFERVPLYID